MPYVVTAPPHVRGVYDSWSECKEAVEGVSGARYQKVKTRWEGEASRPWSASGPPRFAAFSPRILYPVLTPRPWSKRCWVDCVTFSPSRPACWRRFVNCLIAATRPRLRLPGRRRVDAGTVARQRSRSQVDHHGCGKPDQRKKVRLTFIHQPGHRSTWAGRNDLARFNACADKLAKQGREQ